MSYFYKNKVYDYYQENFQSNGSFTWNKGDEYIIEVINNEKITFDFTSLAVHTKNAGILNFDNVETIKIHIDWGDGTSDRLSKPLISNKSSIGVYRPNQWKVIDHFFNVTKRYEYKTNSSEFLHKITITAYNSFNDKLVITIPYKMVYKTLYDLGSELSLFSSNTTNTNKVSYTLKQKSSDSMIVVMSRDWRSIYGDDEIETIEETVSEVFADEFADEDMAVWDWKSIPTINLTVTLDDPQKGINGSFQETGIAIDKWEPYVVFPKDDGDLLIPTTKDTDNTYSFNTSKSSMTPGIYAVSVNPIIGINGVKGSSDVKYVSYNTTTRPRQLGPVTSKSVISVNNTANKKEITFNYTLSDQNQQVKNLTKAQLILTAEFKDKDRKDQVIDDIRFSYNLLDTLIDRNGTPFYVKNKSDENESYNFSYTIKMRNIPNKADYKNADGTTVKADLQYKVQFITNDVLGGDDYVWQPNDSNNPFSFDYDVGSFDSDSVTVGAQNQTNKEINYTWKFDTEDEWAEYKIKWIHIDSDNKETLISSDVHRYTGNNTFDDLTTTVSNNKISQFKKIFDGNIIPNGNYRIENEYNVPMNDYYETRTAKNTKTGTFTYKTPNITIDDIRPFVKINYDRLKDKQYLTLAAEVYSSYTAEPLKNITLTVDGRTFDVPELNYVYDFSNGSAVTKSFKFTAQNANDLYNRNGEKEQWITLNKELTNLLTLPSNGVDYFTDDASKVFVVEETGENVSWLWVKQNTLHDINKKFSFSNGKYFGSDDCGSFIFGNPSTTTTVNRYAVYEIVTLKDGDTTYRRFKPYRGSTTSLGSSTTLKAVNDVVKTTASSQYQKFTDKGTLDLVISNKSSTVDLFADVAKIKDMYLHLYFGSELIGTYDVRGMNDFHLENLSFGTYTYKIVMNSEFTTTNSNTSTASEIKILVPPADAVIYTTNPSTTLASDGKSKYVTWKWEVNHTSAEEIIFKYKVTSGPNKDADGDFKYVKSQNVFQSQKLADGDVIEYYFLFKSKHLNTTGLQTEQDGNSTYYVINKKTFTIPSS